MTELTIISDPICPWCYIGWVRLSRALEARPNHPFQIRWHPFQLNPEMPAEGMDRRAYLEGKFGGPEGARQAYAPVLAAADATGLAIDFAAIPRTPNTLDAHRLIHWAAVEGRQTPVAIALFRRYFDAGQDISDPAILAEIATDAGLEAELVARLLAGPADREETRAADRAAREMGVTGVPTFIVDRRHAVPGAQDTSLWLRVIDDLAAASPLA